MKLDPIKGELIERRRQPKVDADKGKARCQGNCQALLKHLRFAKLWRSSR